MANLSNINGKFVVEQTTGYVGVGTTDPNYPIEVLNASAEIALNASGASIYRLKSDSTDSFRINKNGVGDRLVIAGNGNATFAGTVKTQNTSANAYPYFSIEASAKEYHIGVGGASAVAGYANNLYFYDNTAAAIRMLINTSGNVGIGTDSPDFALDIEAVSSGVQLQMGRTTTSAGSTWMGSDSNGFHLGVGAYGTGNSVADPNGFTVLTSGNVGIGTASPGAKLVISNGGALGYEIDPANASGEIVSIFSYNRSTAAWKTTRYSALDHRFEINGTTEAMRIDSGGSIIIGAGATSGTPSADYRSLEIGRQGNTITGAPWKSNLYFSTNATITAGSTTFTYRYASELPTKMIMEDGFWTFSNAVAGSVGGIISFTERMRIYPGGDITMGQFSNQQAPTNGILKIRTSGSTANVCYPLLYVGGSTHLSTRQYGIGFDPEGYVDRMKMFFGVDGMGNGYSFGDFVWNIQAVADGATVTPADERMRLDKGGDLKLKTGSLVITDTSKGILLGGTSTAHKLGFYKTDTWAPQIYYQNATDQANATNSTQTGIYTKIGNVCTVQFRLIWNQASGAPAVDNIGIKNLPFGGNTTQAYAEVPCSLIGYTGGPSPRGNLTLTLPGANQTLAIFNDTNNVGNMGNAIGSGTKEIRFSFTYLTN